MDKNPSTKQASLLATALVPGGLRFLPTSRSSFPCRGVRVGLGPWATQPVGLSASKFPRSQGRPRGAMGLSNFGSPRAWT